MAKIRVQVVLLVLIVTLVVVACGPGQSQVPDVPLDQPGGEGNALPVYVVTQTGVSSDAAQALVDVLGLTESPWDEDGALRYLDQARFQYIPTISYGVGEPDEDGVETVLEGFDLEALQEITVIDDGQALSQAQAAWEQAGLVLWGEDSPLAVTTSVGHSTFDLFDPNDVSIASAVLDTQVLYAFSLDGVPLLGPGAKVKLVFDGDGVVTQLHYAMRRLEPGGTVPVISQAEAVQRCKDAYGNQNAQVQAELIYYAPPLEMSSVSQITPHYICSGETTVGEETFSLLRVTVPAMVDLPQVQLNVEVEGNDIVGRADVTGGSPPFTYQWTSSSTPLDPDLAGGGAEIQYTVSSREPVENETLGVVVRDAEGLVATAEATLPFEGETTIIGSAGLNSGGPLARPAFVDGYIDVGIEWTGLCCSDKIWTAPKSAYQYERIFRRAGVKVLFNWGEKLVWEKDFRDTTLHGIDHMYADNVDLVWVNAHGGPRGFGTCVEKDTRPFHHTTARWGDDDLEWVALDSCSVLRLNSKYGGLAARWGNAFQGLHILMGYDTDSWGNEGSGFLFPVMLTGNDPLGRRSLSRPRMMRQAWADMSTSTQPSSVIYSILGPCGTRQGQRYIADLNDWFHGEGYIGPDLFQSNITAFWLIRSPS